ncbi:MAG: lipocalin family protein [Acetobacteraceae bacterium]
MSCRTPAARGKNVREATHVFAVNKEMKRMSNRTSTLHQARTATTVLLSGAALVGLGGFVAGRITTMPPVGNAHVPQPRKSVDLERYLGRWYELGRFENRFERGCEDVTATYSLLPDGRIRVVNACSTAWREARTRTATGTAKIVPDSGNSKLKVSFFGPFYLGNYWVLDHDQDYTWAIVGEPSGRYLWILSRVPSPEPEVREHLWTVAADLGYDTSLIRPTRQQSA